MKVGFIGLGVVFYLNLDFKIFNVNLLGNFGMRAYLWKTIMIDICSNEHKVNGFDLE